MAEKNGLFVIQATGDSASILNTMKIFQKIGKFNHFFVYFSSLISRKRTYYSFFTSFLGFMVFLTHSINANFSINIFLSQKRNIHEKEVK